jgi:RNA polymerase subunit RPABC4/transcription elongation factor Spt4
MTGGNEPGPGRACPWCSAPVPADATHCPACGDALARRESIDDLAIPGVTTVDRALEADAAQPLQIPLPMPSSVDSIGGSINLAGMAELAALAARDGSRADSPVGPSTVGKPSDAALKAVERLDREDASR